MSTPQSVKSFFERARQPGDLVFAVFFLVLSSLLLSQLPEQSAWIKGTKVFAQPMFWPAVSLIGMTLFATAHLISSLLSTKIPGRKAELIFWLRSAEYALWFMIYVWLVPFVGYLPCTIVFSLLLALRIGYRDARMLSLAGLMGAIIVVIFKGFLSVKIPAGSLYEALPNSLRNFMILYL